MLLFHRHKWKPHPKAKEITKLLSNFGIFCVKVEECENTKCRKVRLHQRTFVDTKLKVVVLRPYPEEEVNQHNIFWVCKYE